MADDDRGREGQDEPSLELPRLRSAFRRRGRRPRSPQPVPHLAPPAAVPAPPVTPGPIGLPEAPAPTGAEPTAVLPAAEGTGDTLEAIGIRGADANDAEPEPAPEPTRPRRTRRPRPVLRIPGPVAAAVTGLLVGLALVGLTWLGLRGCTALRGTSSCGNPGALVLIAITVVAVLLGSLLLRLARVATHGSTSFLGVGLLVVLVLLALLPVVDRWWMAVVVPVLGAMTYLFAWWLTTTYVEPGERPR